MHTTAIITNIDSNLQYSVTFGTREPQYKVCESFEEAFRVASEWVNWDMQYLKFDILPDDIRKIIDRTLKEHNKEALERRVKKTYADYLQAKEDFEMSGD